MGLEIYTSKHYTRTIKKFVNNAKKEIDTDMLDALREFYIDRGRDDEIVSEMYWLFYECGLNNDFREAMSFYNDWVAEYEEIK